ncbi:MAG: 50S ribosomal protein L18e [Candidatus Aenigmarchaeota archaeon]|nr:50S ribosomal protein L18e [Candidatus Aenigmarchaeota archaeon]
MPKPTGPTDPNTAALITAMKKKKEKFYLNLAKHLTKPSRSKRPVNVTKISKYANGNEPVAVPGKVLGSGEISKAVTVYAASFSKEARKKITKAGGKCLPLGEADKKARIII